MDLFGERHQMTARFFNNVGVVFGKLGEHKKDLEYKKKALDISMDLFGERHPDTARFFNAIGRIYWNLSDHKKALEFEQKALEIRKSLFDERHLDTAQSFNDIGYTYRALGNYLTASQNFEKALSIFREKLGEQHRDTTRSAISLTEVLLKLGHNDKAIKIVNHFVRALPKKHPDRRIFKQYDKQLQSSHVRPGFRQPSNKPTPKKGKKKKIRR